MSLQLKTMRKVTEMASHEELIKVGSFNDKFKNALRDYYTYGFKTYVDLQSQSIKGKLEPSASTINADWVRLNNILRDYFEWSVDKNQVFFMSTDSQSMSVNPFHRIYRFCRYNERDPKTFFNTILALSPSVSLAHGMESLELNDFRVNALSDEYLRFEEYLCSSTSFTSAELLCFFPDNSPLFVGENNTINKRLKELKDLGFISDIAEKKVGAQKAVHRWELTNYYIASILEQGYKIDDSFVVHFTNALDFFSKYEQLGEIGSIILGRYFREYQSAFRFKHEYYMQSLNDYNLIDLLHAIEENYWCKIEYRHAVTGKKSSIICYPLEIRISSTGGREYLSFYEPFSRSYSNLRVEFIDSIEYIKDGGITTKDGKIISTKDSEVKNDIKNARKSLKYSWGASTTVTQIGNAVKEAPLYDVHLKIAFDPHSEAFIRNRVYREQRIGTIYEHDGFIEFSVRVTDVRELRPWIRSFYSRLVESSGIEEFGFSIKSDLTEMKYVSEEVSTLVIKSETTDSPAVWCIPEGTMFKTFPCEAHLSLFNEFFSIYYAVISDVLMTLYADKKKESFTEIELRSAINVAINKYQSGLGMQSRRLLSTEILGLLTSNAFMREGLVEKKSHWVLGVGSKDQYGPWMLKSSPAIQGKQTAISYLRKYTTKVDSFYSSVLPLSLLEYRWLITIIDNPKMKLFLSTEEIQYLKTVLSSEKNKAQQLPMGAIHYTDRFNLIAESRPKEIEIMNPLLFAIQNHKKVFVEYISAKGKKQSGVFAPIIIEFSKRDNVFRGYFYSVWNKKISIMNIARLQSFRVLDEEYDYDKALWALVCFRKKNTRELTIEFYDEKNVPDRILSEFAPWKKRCVYDRDTKLYRLTIFYQKQDSFELVVRLLGYGSAIRILERDSRVFEQYIMRVDKQVAIERERDTERAKEQSRNDDTKGI